LAQRSLDLTRAQEKRIKSSEVQGTILGVGQGDGAEASELSQVRGEQAAASLEVGIGNSIMHFGKWVSHRKKSNLWPFSSSRPKYARNDGDS
jgi:hypothetical protein